MTSPLQARQTAAEAVAKRFHEMTHFIAADGFRAIRVCDDKELAEAAVAVLLGTPDTPCHECRGMGRVVSEEGSYMAGGQISIDCQKCGGSGVVPGTAGLRVPCDNPYCDDGIAFGGSSGNDFAEPCTDCANQLAAIDVARGAE